MWVFWRERTWIRLRAEFQFPGVDPIKMLLVAENDQEPRFQESPPERLSVELYLGRGSGRRSCCGTVSGYAL